MKNKELLNLFQKVTYTRGFNDWHRSSKRQALILEKVHTPYQGSKDVHTTGQRNRHDMREAFFTALKHIPMDQESRTC